MIRIVTTFVRVADIIIVAVISIIVPVAIRALNKFIAIRGIRPLFGPSCGKIWQDKNARLRLDEK